MDVVGCLCVSLGNSRVQLHDRLGSNAHAHVQKLVSVVKMAMVLECILPEISVLLCVFCGQKDSMQRILIKKYFLFTVGSICCVKGSQLGRETLSLTFESSR
jgi:hypothetical protein